MREGAAEVPGGDFKLCRVAAVQACDAEQPHFVDILSDRAARFWLGFHKQAECRAAGYGLKPQRAGACENIRHNRPVKRRGPIGVGEDIENGFTRLIRRRARVSACGCGDIAASEFAGNNTH